MEQPSCCQSSFTLTPASPVPFLLSIIIHLDNPCLSCPSCYQLSFTWTILVSHALLAINYHSLGQSLSLMPFLLSIIIHLDNPCLSCPSCYQLPFTWTILVSHALLDINYHSLGHSASLMPFLLLIIIHTNTLCLFWHLIKTWQKLRQPEQLTRALSG